jgi:hypothetical protein
LRHGLAICRLKKNRLESIALGLPSGGHYSGSCEYRQFTRDWCRQWHPATQFGQGVTWVGELSLRRFERAVTSCAGADGLVNRMLLGTPCEAHSSAAAPVM